MIFGITMSSKNWAITLTIIALAISLPFALAAFLAPMVPPSLSDITYVAIGYMSLPLVLSFLYDRGKLYHDLTSVFFYLYKWAYLATGIVAIAIANTLGGGFESGVMFFGIATTVIALMMFWHSWKVDKRNAEADLRRYGDEAPLDSQTQAILDAATARAAGERDRPLLLDDPIRT